MKKTLFSLLSATALLWSASCQDEAIVSAGDGEAMVQFTVELDGGGVASRSGEETSKISDGTKVTQLYYEVYSVVDGNRTYLSELDNWKREEGESVVCEPKTITNGKANVQFALVKGQSYEIVFWAQSEGSVYDALDLQNIVVYNDTTKANNDAYDAFTAVQEVTVTGANKYEVKLTRPFAQVNFGTTTTDIDAATAAGLVFDGESGRLQSQISVKNTVIAYNALKEEAVRDENGYITTDNAIFAYNVVPSFEETLIEFGKETEDVSDDVTYKYLATAYVLTPAKEQVLADLEMKLTTNLNEEITISVPGAPVQRNYRTNVLGNLLTNQTDFTVVIDAAFEKPDKNLKGFKVGETCYDDLAEAIAAALESNNEVVFLKNAEVDADNTITIAAETELTLNLNGFTLAGVTDEATSNREMFLVKGTLNVKNGYVTLKHIGDNMGWNAMTTIFDVTAGGILNIDNAYATNYGGSNMAFVAHLNNWGEVTLNVNESTLESNYVAVRVFNSGNDKNNVTIKKSTLKGGSYAFWVHNFTAADFGTQEKAEAHRALLNFDVFNGTNEFIGKNLTPVRLGMTNALYADENGVIPIIEDDKVVDGIGMDLDGNYAVSGANGLMWVASKINNPTATVADENSYVVNGSKITLVKDIDLTGVTTKGDSFGPIGRYCSGQGVNNPFTGHFDGNGHTIKGIYQSGWDFGYEWGTTGYLGLFGYVKDATIENLTIEGMESVVEGGTLGAVAGRADGSCIFKNITVKDTKLGTYNNRCGGIVGWTGYYKNEADETVCDFVFENINICEDVVLGGLWGSFDSSIGGVMGQLNSGATSCLLKNVTVSCRIDAYNDCTASYDYYLYRMCGMLIGQMSKTTTIDGSTYPNVAAYGIEFDNVTVNYGTWMNYHYCEPTPGLNGGRGMRVEPGFAYDGLPADFDHTQCVDNHYNCIPFDQLFGGTQIACKGVKAWEGVTVNYPAEYTCTLCGEQHNVAQQSMQ